MSLIPLFLCKKLQLLDLTSTNMSIQLAYCSIKRPAGLLADVPLQVGMFVSPCDFVVIDMDENPEVPVILGRPFLATAGAVMDVQAGIMSFRLCGEKIDFHFPPYPAPIPPFTNQSPVNPIQSVLPAATPDRRQGG